VVEQHLTLAVFFNAALQLQSALQFDGRTCPDCFLDGKDPESFYRRRKFAYQALQIFQVDATLMWGAKLPKLPRLQSILQYEQLSCKEFCQNLLSEIKCPFDDQSLLAKKFLQQFSGEFCNSRQKLLVLNKSSFKSGSFGLSAGLLFLQRFASLTSFRKSNPVFSPRNFNIEIYSF